VEQCERLTLIAAAKRVTAKLCHEGRFHLGVEKRPVFVGENRGCKVAPYNTFYEQLEKHLETCRLDASACRGWDAPVVLGANEGTVGTGVELLSAEYFAPFIVPFRGTSTSSSSTQANPFAVPPEYVRALDTKVRAVASLRSALRDAGLGEHARRELQATIQAFFREWLTSSGSMRQVYDLARIERGE
jgi:TBCC domain-containing protein 1